MRRNHYTSGIKTRIFYRIHIFLNGSNNLGGHTEFPVYSTDNFLVRNIPHIITEYEEVRIQFCKDAQVVFFVMVITGFHSKNDNSVNVTTFIQNEQRICLSLFKEILKFLLERRKSVHSFDFCKYYNVTPYVQQRFKQNFITVNLVFFSVRRIGILKSCISAVDVNSHRRSFCVSVENAEHLVSNFIHFAAIINRSKVFFKCLCIIRRMKKFTVFERFINHIYKEAGCKDNCKTNSRHHNAVSFVQIIDKHKCRTKNGSRHYIQKHNFQEERNQTPSGRS